MAICSSDCAFTPVFYRALERQELAGEGLHSHLSRDNAAAKMGHPFGLGAGARTHNGKCKKRGDAGCVSQVGLKSTC